MTSSYSFVAFFALALAVRGAPYVQSENDIMSRPSQAVAVSGQLLCNGEPAPNVLIKLYDHDTFTLDDLMAETESNAEGRFLITGHAHEISRITPKVNLYHDCNDWLPCQRKVSVYVPKKFVTEGSEVAEKTFDIGVMELSGEFSGESRDCFHK